MGSIEEMLHNIAVCFKNLSEMQRFVIMGVLAVLGIIWIVRKSPKDAYDIGDDGSKPRTGGSTIGHRSQTTRRKEFYTTPGTYDIREAHPHKFTQREKPREQSKKSWDKDLDDWVKKRKTKRR